MKKLLALIAFALTACTETPPPNVPMLATEAFQKSCEAAVMLEAVQKGQQVPEQVFRLCSDPALPGRLATLVVLAASEIQAIQVILAPKAADAGAR